jgi:drug/metabolite transporter superfamily protein YnfA
VALTSVSTVFHLAALFDLNGPAHYVHWHFFQMSVSNLIVILMMIAVFIAALLIPFPRRRREP